MSAASMMAEELSRRRAGFSLPRPFYTDADYGRLDLEHLFYRTWLFAGHEAELPSRGHYLTLQIGDYPVVLVRRGEGDIRAFHNTCRHRGSVVCTEARGRTVRLVCPYHQWSYGLDGQLLRGRRMGEGFDPAPYALKPVHARTVGGLIFVCVAEEAPDFEPFRAAAEPYLAVHRLAEAKVAFEETIVERGNWKLVWENNRECYHCASNHPELCRTFPETPTITGIDGLSDPTVLGHWRRCEDAGLPSRFRLSEDGQHRVVRMPLLEGAVSYTMSGAAAVARPLAELGAGPVGTLMLFHFPSIWLHVLADHACTFQVLPLGPQETQLTTKWLVHRDAVEGVDYEVDELTRVWRATNEQDRRVVQDNQRGINSPAYQPGPYAPEDENGVEQFVDWYCASMQKALPATMPGERRVA